MTLKEFKKRLVNRPYPWQCPRCLKPTVFPATISHTARVLDRDEVRIVHVPELRISRCQACGELLFTNGVDVQIDRALRLQKQSVNLNVDHVASTPSSSSIEYARLMHQLRKLILQGADLSEEGGALRDEMAVVWYGMTIEEQTRMLGLAEDLYTLSEGNPPRVALDADGLPTRQQQADDAVEQLDHGNADAMLAFLRRPLPSRLSLADVRQLQAQCWDKLGDAETAAIFRAAVQDQHANGTAPTRGLQGIGAKQSA